MVVEALHIAYIIYIVVYFFPVALLYSAFFEKRRTRFPYLIVSYLLYAVITGVSVFVMNNTLFIHVSISLATHFIISLNYKSSMIRRVAGLVCIFLCLAFAETVALFVSMRYVIEPFVSPHDTLIFNLTDSIIMFAVSFLTTFVIALMLRNLKGLRRNTISSSGFWIISFATSILLIVVIFLAGAQMSEDFAMIVTTIAFAIGVASFYFQNSISYAHEEKLKFALHAQEKEYYFAQCQLMQESAEQVKSIRHDMKLHLFTMKGYAVKVSADEIVDYANGLLDNIGESEVYSDTGNIAFDSIINFKLKNAVDENIKLDINVLVPPYINIEVADVVTILGNLLDNALDAVAKVEDKRIKLNVIFNKGNLVIKTENTFDGEVKYAKGNGGAEKIIATRKGGSDHGHGLSNICRSVGKYDGHVDISHKGNVFSVSVLLYVDDISRESLSMVSNNPKRHNP